MSKPIHSPQAKRLRQLLIQYRKKAGLTQADLAARINRPQTFISKLEIGERRIDVIELVQLLGAMKASPVAFISRLIKSRP